MKDTFIKHIQEIVSIESVANPDSVNQEYPYGKGVADALAYVLNLCQNFGFRTKNCNNKTGWAEIGSGEPLIGILVHLDTVPIGEGWTKKQGEICDGKLYGRGVNDDKGPAMACIYAMKEILESNQQIDGRIRIIFGQLEETGIWTDIEYYKETEEIPSFGFTPDADFPVIYAEKGICTLELSAPVHNDLIVSLSGGTASNVVPAKCEIVLQNLDNTTSCFNATGRSAHASTPEKGINAISMLMEKLYVLHQSGNIEFPFAEFYHKYIGTDLHGESIGCYQEDNISGKLTLNPGLISYKDKKILLKIDIRYPVTGSYEKILENMIAVCNPYHITVTTLQHMKPVYTDIKTPFVQKLLATYQNETNDLMSPISIGGGTYARAMDHIVAYGALLPGRPLTEHQPDEYMLIEDLYTAKRIYYNALLLLTSSQK